MPPRAERLRQPSASPGRASPTLSALWVRGLLEALDGRGIAVPEFLAEAGLPPDRFAQPYAWVPTDEFDRLLALALQLTHDAAFGLHWVERSQMNRFDLFALIAAHAPTLREAMQGIASVQRILWPSAELELEERGDSYSLWCTPAGCSELGCRVRAELIVYGYLRLLRYFGIPVQAVRRIQFAHARPPYEQEYRRLFALAPRFGRARTGVEIASGRLDLPLVGANAELFDLFRSQANVVLGRVSSGTSHVVRVRQRLEGALPRLPAMRETARALGLSVRSLHRRLLTEGTSYARLVEEAQRARACRLLADPACSVKQVSHEVGFHSTTAFVRAFRRWTGRTPSGYRAALGSAGERVASAATLPLG